jgi:hypothetical protein
MLRLSGLFAEIVYGSLAGIKLPQPLRITVRE